ncbi:MAG: hypothetical protein DRI57_01870 [Deltaproteobacteria bacterium]|nr:MAG: hypothetical protein DRI57_01870 [Deltaproteobacteria bacterium]
MSGQEKNCRVPSSVVANDNWIRKGAERLKEIGGVINQPDNELPGDFQICELNYFWQDDFSANKR